MISSINVKSHAMHSQFTSKLRWIQRNETTTCAHRAELTKNRPYSYFPLLTNVAKNLFRFYRWHWHCFIFSLFNNRVTFERSFEFISSLEIDLVLRSLGFVSFHAGQIILNRQRMCNCGSVRQSLWQLPVRKYHKWEFYNQSRRHNLIRWLYWG